MSEEQPATPPETVKSGPPPASRFVVTIVTLGALSIMAYSATQRDYRSMIVSALVVLFTLGADLTAILRSWRGGGQ